MQNSIKSILSQKHDTQTKKELVELLSSFSDLIGAEEYQKVSGIDPKTELETLTKKEIVAVLGDFNENYKATWEESIGNAANETIRSIFGQMEADDVRFDALNTDAASNADFVAELGSIDFENIIGGPLNAAVAAQNNASLATVSFIKEVGFKDDEIRMVDFSYTKSVPDSTPALPDPNATIPDPNNPNATIPDPALALPDPNAPPILRPVVIKVPFISVLNVPSLRIETVDIEFNVKLNSVFTKETSSEFGLNVDYSKEVGIGKIYSSKFKVSVSYKRTTSSGVRVEKEYSLNVKVKATNDEMPAGLEKVLGLLSA